METNSPNGKFIAAARRIAIQDYIWRPDLDSTELVIFEIDSDGTIQDRVSKQILSFRLITKIQWSPDSRFLVMTTSSSGGHSPWHFKSYVICVDDGSMHYMDDVIGSVLAPEFDFKGKHSVQMTVHDISTGLGPLDSRKMSEVDLEQFLQKQNPSTAPVKGKR